MALNGHQNEKTSGLSHNETSGQPKEIDLQHHESVSWTQSPYMLGAAFLASMGGFSYGYGNTPHIDSLRTS